MSSAEIAWERAELPFWRRFYETVASSFAPRASVPSIASASVGPALRFALLTALPWLLLWAITPFTHTLQFGFGFSVQVLPGGSSNQAIAWDIARASLIGLCVGVLSLLTWAAPFASLMGAFGQPPEGGLDARRAAICLALYRAWLAPCGLTLLYLLAWSLPQGAAPTLLPLGMLGLQVMPRLLLVVHCFALARYFRVGGLSGMVVVGVPLLVELTAGLLINQGATRFLPPAPEALP